MDSIVEKLQALGLDQLLNQFQQELCSNTANQNKAASVPHFDADQGAASNHPPDNFSKCEKLCELIQKTAEVKSFLETLDETEKEHIIKFINEKVFSAFDQTPSTSTSANPNRSQNQGIWFNIPGPIESFCGREDFLSQLHDQLKPRDDAETEVTVLSQVKIVSGLGGIGKTQTARKYISQYFKFYNNFIWIDAETEISITNSFFKLAEEIQIPIKNSKGTPRGIEEVVKEIYNKICDGGESNLIVFDNAEDYLSCRQFFSFGLDPDLTKPVILATSRNQDWISPTGKIQVLPLDKMTDDESVEFISKQLEIPESEIPGFREESREFIELMGGLPLALQQAVAYIKAERQLAKFIGQSYKISDYVKEFKKSMKKFLSFSPVPAPDSSPTVYATWNVTFEKIQKLAHGESAVKILEILSFLYADKIPLGFLRPLLPKIKNREFSKALKLLNKYSLIKMNVRDCCLSIHRQVQFVILQHLDECAETSKSKLLTNVWEKCRFVLEKVKAGDESENNDIFLNIHRILKIPFEELESLTSQFIQLTAQFALALEGAGRIDESLEMYERTLRGFKDFRGEDDEQTIEVLAAFAIKLAQFERYDEFFTISKPLLMKMKVHPDFGDGHRSTIDIKIFTACSLMKQNKFQESLSLYQEIFSQQVKILGESHPETVNTKLLIAWLRSLLHAGHSSVSSARPQQKQQQPQQKKVEANVKSKILKEPQEQKNVATFPLEENPPDTQTPTVTVATLIALIEDFNRDPKNLQKSLNVHKKLHEWKKGRLGEGHPDTIDVKLRIAAVLLDMDKYEESLQIFQEVHNQLPKTHGQLQQRALEGQYRLAMVYFCQGGREKEGLELLQDVEQKQTEIFGADHWETVGTTFTLLQLFSESSLDE